MVYFVKDISMNSIQEAYKVMLGHFENYDNDLANIFRKKIQEESPRKVFIFLNELKFNNKLPISIENMLEEFWWTFCN